MKERRRIVAVGLALSLFHISLVQSAVAAPAVTTSIREQVSVFGTGAEVKLKLARGEKLRGSIEAIDDSGFLFLERNRAARRITYDEVAHLAFPQRYKAKGEPDPLQARRVVLALGVGKHVGVKFSGREVHGHIQAIGGDHFTVLPDKQAAPVEIAFNEVRYVEKNLSAGATIVLVVVVAAVVVVILAAR